MTTWLPAICGLWAALCATVFATDPLFRGHDRTFGWVLGITVGIVTGAVLYVGVRMLVWIIGGVI